MAKQRRKDIHIAGWDVWEFFARLWPLILIAWGAWKLYYGLKEKQEEKIE
jgi:hypothetical protein